MPLRWLPALLLSLALAAVTGRACADEQRDLDKVRAAYLARQYDLAEARLRALLDPKSGTLHDPAMVTQGRMYLAAVYIATGETEQANTVVERLLLEDPQYEPDPLSFPTEVIDFFIDAKARLRDKLNAMARERARVAAERRAREAEQKRLEAERLALLERLAGEEKVTDIHSRWRALVPFGVGQFQNRRPALGWAFLSTEAVLLVGAAVTVPIYLTDLQSRSDAYRAGNNYVAGEYVSRAYTVRDVNLVFNGLFALAAVTGILEAELNYVPSVVEVRRRVVPQLPWTPVVTPPPAGVGGVFGVVGRF